LGPTLSAQVEDGRRAAEPDVRLWIDPLEAQAIQNLLRSHIQPAHVDVRTHALERVLQQRELIAPVRGIQDHWRAAIGTAAGQ
jgi:hypothetical protein